MAEDFAGKIALVTGGGNGIGAATCRAFAATGARVAILDRDTRAADAVATEITGRGGNATAYAIDVADRAAFAGLAAAIAETSGGIDILVNGAGTTVRRMIAEMSPDDWDRVIAVNLTGAFNGIQAVLPHLRARGGGAIVNVASIAGRGGHATSHVVDVADRGAFAAAAAEIAEAAGGIDILVNGAGTTVRRMIPDMSPEDWDRVIAVNLTGAFNGIQAVLPYMRRRGGGAVINVASIAG